jgi:RluA family pseudouridine synthase
MTAPSFTRCPILFEDADLIVVDKPGGVLSHPNPGTQGSACAFEGAYDLGDRRFQTPQGPVWLVHRLDQDTSGVLLAAKNKKSVAACRNAFEERSVKKSYIALVSRRPMPAQGIWRDALTERRTGGGVRTAINPSGRPNAFLNYKMKESFPKFNLSLLEIELLTGKTHQIRVQSAYHDHPVAGDRVYGNFTLNKELRQALDLRRLFLHAWRLILPHPTSGKLLTIESPLPEDLENCLLRASSTKR